MSKERTRYRVRISGMTGVRDLLRAVRITWTLYRINSRYGIEKVAAALEEITARTDVTVRWTGPGCPSRNRDGHPCAYGPSHLDRGIRHGDPAVGASGINWDDEKV